MTRSIGLTIGTQGHCFFWNMSHQDVVSLVGEQNVTRVKAQYYVTSPLALNGISAKLAMSFSSAGLCRVELLPTDCGSLEESYENYQRFLVQSLGPPDVTGDADGGFKYHHWNKSDVKIVHTVIDRFDLSEVIVLSPQE